MASKRTFECSDCGERVSVAHGTARPTDCPKCQSSNIHRVEEDRGWGRGGCRGRGASRGKRGVGVIGQHDRSDTSPKETTTEEKPSTDTTEEEK